MKNYCSVDIHLNKFPSDSYVCQPAPMLSQATVSSLVPEDENKEEEGLSSPDKIDGSEVADDVDMEDVVSEEKVPSSGGDEEARSAGARTTAVARGPRRERGRSWLRSRPHAPRRERERWSRSRRSTGRFS